MRHAGLVAPNDVTNVADVVEVIDGADVGSMPHRYPAGVTSLPQPVAVARTNPTGITATSVSFQPFSNVDRVASPFSYVSGEAARPLRHYRSRTSLAGALGAALVDEFQDFAAATAGGASSMLEPSTLEHEAESLSPRSELSMATLGRYASTSSSDSQVSEQCDDEFSCPAASSGRNSLPRKLLGLAG